MKVRNIPGNLPREICKKAKEKYMDTKTGYNVAVKEVIYKGKARKMAVVYEEITEKVKIIADEKTTPSWTFHQGCLP